MRRKLAYLLRLLFEVAALLAILGGSMSALAQDWTKLGTLPANARCGYFWNFNHGVVGCYTAHFGVSNPGLYWYDNGTWTQSKYPEPPGAFSSIRELTPGHLYVAQGATQVWVSTDSGKTWDTTGIHSGVMWSGWPTPVPAEDVYLGGDNNIHVVPGRLKPGGSGLMLAGGSFSRIDAQNCIISYMNPGQNPSDMGVPYYSHDGGLTWNRSTGMNETGGFGCFADSCQHVFFTAAEWGSVYFSADSGVTWQPCASQLDAGAGDMDVLDGANGTLYKQTVSSGVHQSVDGGASWQWIRGSPKGSIEDTHIIPVGTYGSEFVAFSGHDVWYVTGANFNSKPASPITVWDSTLHECYSVAEVPVLIRPTGIRHKLHFLTEGDSTHLILPNDTTILTPAHDSVVVLFHITPPDIRGASSLRIHSHIGDNCFPLDWDTTFVDTIAATAFGITGASATSLLACDSATIPIAIHSALCDSLVSGTTQIANDTGHYLSLLPISKHLFAPGESDTIWIKYVPRGHPEQRSYSVHLTGLLAPSNVKIDTVMNLQLTALPDKRCNQDTVKGAVEMALPVLEEFNVSGKVLSFSFSSPNAEGSGNAEIVDVLGAVVGSQRILGGSDVRSSVQHWDLSQLPAGVYLLRVTGGDHTISKRFAIE